MKRDIVQPGQESVWDYPRPPRVESTNKLIQVVFGGQTIVETRQALRVLETSHPPVYYVPRVAVLNAELVRSSNSSFCEFKGQASYWTIQANGQQSKDAAWSYEQPISGYEALKGYLAFYPGRVEACYVDGELVQAQAGDFYGGWVTADIVGPFKGPPGTLGW